MSVKSKIAAAVSLHMLAWLAMFIVLTGVIFLAIGVYWLLAPPLGPAAAALIVGGGLLGIVLLLALVGVIAARSNAARRTRKTDTDTPIEHQLRPLIGDRATEWTRNNTGLAIIGALSAGVLIAANPSLRRFAYNTVRPLIARKALQLMRDFTGGD